MAAEEGRRAVMAEAVSGAGSAIAGAARAAAGEQLPMFAVPTRFDGEVAAELEEKRRRGRPPGAQNRATREFREWLLARGVDPHVWMTTWLLNTPETLARELECSKLEAFDRLLGLARELAPYIRGKALPVDDDGKVLPFLQMIIGGQIRGARDGRPPWDYEGGPVIEETAVPQALPHGQNGVSHGDVSHGIAK